MFLVITNGILLIPGIISMIPHFVFDKFVNSDLQLNFYIYAYSHKSFKYWWWPTVVSCGVVLLMFGPAIGIRISRRFRKKHIVDTEDEFALDRADVIKDKTGLAKNPAHRQVWRFLLSYFLFLLILAISGILTVGFVAAQYYAFNNTFAGSILVSVIITIINAIWTEICSGLTAIEAHYTWTSFKNHNTLKLFIWKILNVCLMFLGQWLVTRCYLKNVPIWSWIFSLSEGSGTSGLFAAPSVPTSPPTFIPITPISILPPSLIPFFGSPTATPTATPSAPGVASPSNSTSPATSPSAECTYQCELGNLGNQFITLLLTDLVLSNFIRLAWPFFGWKLWGCCTGKKISRESDNGRIEFDIAINYLDLLYRQFIVYLGTPFVPWLPILGMFVNGIQIPIDKWRLLKFCKTPPFLSGSMKHFLVFFLFISALVSIAVFPYGTGWVLSSYTLSSTCPNTIFGKHSNATIT